MRTQEEKFVLIFDALKRTLISYDILQKRLLRDLRELEPKILRHEIRDEDGVEPLLTAVSMTDTAHRFGQLFDALPFINKKTAESRALAAALKPVESARHYFQHMRRELISSEVIDFPVLGNLSWANGLSSFMLSFSQKDPSHHYGLVWDTQESVFVREIEYTVQAFQMDIQAIGQQMHLAYDWLGAVATFNPPEFAELKWSNTMALALVIHPAATH